MVIDLKTILIEHFTSMFENHLGLIAIVFAVAIVAFIFRHYIAFYLDLSQREENKLIEKIILIPIVILMLTAGYLYAKQHFFLLSIELSFILTYILYIVGIFDMLVEKLESRYGR